MGCCATLECSSAALGCRGALRGTIVSQLIFLVVMLLLLVATYCDLRTRQVPDWIALAVLVVSTVAAAAGAANIRWWMVVSGGAVGLAVGVCCSALADWAGATPS
jgi:Flp pilus assembly protein protease CpaA